MYRAMQLVSTWLAAQFAVVHAGSVLDDIPNMLAGEPNLPHTSDAWKIWAYSAAAPEYLAKDATVMDGDKELRKGTNGWTCLPANPLGPRDSKVGWHSAHESMPVCCDANGMGWVVPYAAGKGEKPVMKGNGWAWMLMGDMGEDNEIVGKVADWEWGKAHPDDWIQGGSHLMLLPQDPDAWKGYNSDFSTGGPYIMFKNDPAFGNIYAHLMIPGPYYYHYQGKASPTSKSIAAEPTGSHTSSEWMAWAYATAAPAFLVDGVKVVEGDKVLQEPKKWNGFTCLAANPHGPADKAKGWKTPHEAMAICADKNAMAWVAPFAAADPASGKGETPVLEQDGFAWMLHGDMGEDNNVVGKVNDFPWGKQHKEEWIQGGPHLMLLPKNPNAWKTATTEFLKGDPYVMFQRDPVFGNKYAHVMIPQPGYYHYQKVQDGLNPEVPPDAPYWWLQADVPKHILFFEDYLAREAGVSHSVAWLGMVGILVSIGLVVWTLASRSKSQKDR